MPEEAKTGNEETPEGLSDAEKEVSKKEWGQLAKLLQTFPEVKSYSQTKILARSLLGPLSRVWRVDNKIQIGAEKEGTKYIFGEGDNYTEALKLTALRVAYYNADVLAKKKGILNGAEVQDKAGQAAGEISNAVAEGSEPNSPVGGGQGLDSSSGPADAIATKEGA